MTNHGFEGLLALLVVVLAIAGALRWDGLRLWWRELLNRFAAPALAPPPPQDLPHPPADLHPTESAQRPPHSKPAIHRSGRRG